MLKSEYQKLVEEKPWTEMIDVDHEPVEVKKITTLDIDSHQWVQFTLDNFDLAEQKWECPKEHYSELGNKFARFNNSMGRNEHNTFELNYGINGDTNLKLKNLLGLDNIQKLNVLPDTVLVRMLVKMAGHGVPWHVDDGSSYAKRFGGDDNLSNIKRYWFPGLDWQDGHAFQISKTVLTHWKAGDVYEIPWSIGHASTNFGYVPQYTVSFTAVVNA